MYKNCKTEESVSRQRSIEDVLLTAMQQVPYEKITLRSLCEMLNLPRKSLYRYFPTKQDILLGLIDHRLADCNALVFAYWDGARRIDKANLERFFTFWRGEEAFLAVAVQQGFWPLILERTTRIVDTMKQTSTEPWEASFARNQVEYFVAHGLMATVLRWYDQGYPGTPGEMAEVFASVLCSSELSISRLFL